MLRGLYCTLSGATCPAALISTSAGLGCQVACYSAPSQLPVWDAVFKPKQAGVHDSSTTAHLQQQAVDTNTSVQQPGSISSFKAEQQHPLQQEHTRQRSLQHVDDHQNAIRVTVVPQKAVYSRQLRLLGGKKAAKLYRLRARQPAKAVHVYVDGSYRSVGGIYRMTAGIWAWTIHKRLSLAFVLHGGQPSSLRAEYGAIYAAVTSPQVQALARGEERLVILTDNTTCVNQINFQLVSSKQCPDSSSKAADQDMINVIAQQISARKPGSVVVRYGGKVSKEQRHVYGNKQAHDLAATCSAMQLPISLAPQTASDGTSQPVLGY